MLKDITLGQYFPGDTIVHRLDARTKLLLVIIYIAALFTAVDWLSYGLMFAVTVGCTSLPTAISVSFIERTKSCCLSGNSL